MAYLGQWEERVLAMLDELSGEPDWLYLDRLTGLTRAQPGGSAIADFLVPGIRQGTLRIVVECDEREWERAQRSHPELCAQLHVVRLEEPSASEVPALLRAFQERRAPAVTIHPEGYRRLAAHLAMLVRTGAFPGKGFRFLEALVPDPDRAAPRELRPSDVSDEVARHTGLPIELVSDDVTRTRADFAAALRARVIGQDDACEAVSTVLTRFKAGLADQSPAYVRRVREHFRPELVARIDHVVPFRELDPEDVLRIVDLALDGVRARAGLALRGIALEVSAAARAALAARGYQPGKGARALHRVIEEEVVAPIAALLAADPARQGGVLRVDRGEDATRTLAVQLG